jgi:hypothetical protein
LRWARHEKHLKVISAGVPIGVLPSGLEGDIIDVKVFARRGPDDAIYDKNKEIRKRVCILHNLTGFLILYTKLNVIF